MNRNTLRICGIPALCVISLASCCGPKNDGRRDERPPTPVPSMDGAKVSSFRQVRTLVEEGHTATMWMGMWYCGRDDAYHYFENRKKLGGTRRLAVPVTDVHVVGEFPLSLEPEEWRAVSQADMTDDTLDLGSRRP